MRNYIDEFSMHHNITRLVNEISDFREDYNHQWPLEYLNNKTPGEVYYNDLDIDHPNCTPVVPYFKEGELRMKFTDRNGKPARISIPEIKPNQVSTT